MTKQSLEEKSASIEQQFNALVKQRDELSEELVRLQGEYRAIHDLISTFPADDKPKEEIKKRV